MKNYIEPNPIKIKPIENFCLYIKFEDGKEKVYDMKELINKIPSYDKLKKQEYFNLAKIQGETIEWPNGEDICPENLYYDSEDYSEEKHGKI